MCLLVPFTEQSATLFVGWHLKMFFLMAGDASRTLPGLYSHD